MVSNEDRSEIVFFDVETTIPTRTGQGYALLEFGAILVCPKKLVEQHSYSTLVRPSDLSLISNLSVRCNGISRDAVMSAPTFSDIADKVFDILHGRIWAGHNILKFDCPRIQEAFAGINRPIPEPKGTIDTLALLTQRFGRRAGNMKMASLATYFGLGEQSHRSLDDVRMNFEVVKYCATVLFLESSLPDILTGNSWASPNATLRSHTSVNTTPDRMNLRADIPSSSVMIGGQSCVKPIAEDMEVPDVQETTSSRPDPFNLVQFTTEIRETIHSDAMEEEPGSGSRESSPSTATGGYNGCNDFFEPDKISISSVSVSLAPFYRGTRKIQILHNNSELQICCRSMKVRFGISTRFVDYAGRPRLSFVVDASADLCQILDAVDKSAQKVAEDSGSMSEWRPVVNRKPGFVNCPTIRLHLPTVVDGNISRWATEMYQKESSTTQKLMFSRFDVTELDSLIKPGTPLDAYFSVDSYDYQQIAGVRLVAKKLAVHSSG